MPQGGIDEGEEPQAAALRELGEETGIAERHIQFLARAKEEHYYDLPDELVGKIWNGQYSGQRQVWFLARFTGTDDDVNIETDHQAFPAWKLVEGRKGDEEGKRVIERVDLRGGRSLKKKH